ncbi:hypothetical protein JI664_14845 [Rhodobacter sp. NTK016B]|uniref:hypothetical protein n=1 Tax=Rhodobacter sp. NTK016B TaxID=2759676 RepID=UPI001A8C06C8|nr:hypothetical protein [Rhodobacter sp. NTK016B]MBN8293250.1 hypothetical protein [Rhodobacter sp. NTK016B]
MTETFRPLGELADEQVMRLAGRCGRCAVRIVVWLRAHGGVRTLAEIWEEVAAPVPEIEATLARLDAAGLTQHRDMIMDHGTELVWWAPRVVTAAETPARPEDVKCTRA